MSDFRRIALVSRCLLPRKVTSFTFISVLLILPFEWVSIGPAQISQIWCILVVLLLFLFGKLRITFPEVAVFTSFILISLLITFATDYHHIKEIEQTIKFLFVYPAIYLVGRWAGEQYSGASVPYNYIIICCLFAFEVAVQMLHFPVIFKDVVFMQDVIYGTFKERGWLGLFFFFLLYTKFLQGNKTWKDVVVFGAIAAVVTGATGAKMIIPCTGIAVLFSGKDGWLVKSIFLTAGGLIFLVWLQYNLSGNEVNFRVENERGLALRMGLRIIQDDWLGHGFGYVEYYFTHTATAEVVGLGLGANAIFCTPLDLCIIAGMVGVAFWGMFFAGIGVNSLRLMSPVAIWSLANPIHEAEIAYFFGGLIISWGIADRSSRDRLRNGVKGHVGAT
jgi:hypothetical protein